MFTWAMVRPISKLLIDFTHSLNKETLAFSEVIHTFKDRGIAFFLFLFALPAALPAPAIGYGTVLSIPLILLCLQKIIGRDELWLPRSILDKKLKAAHIKGLIDKAVPSLQKIEIILTPRLEFLTNPAMHRVLGLCLLLMALFVAIPLPLTNTVPSMGIALVALGIMTRDGLVVLGGLFIGLLWIGILSTALILFGLEGLDFIKETIKSWV